VVNDTPEKLYVDHINFDRLDNRLINLRNVTYAENIRNRRVLSSNTSGYKGVNFNRRDNTWRVEIKVDGKSKFGGSYTTKEEAISAARSLYAVLHPTSPEAMGVNDAELLVPRRRSKHDMNKNNSSGYKNVFWNKRYEKWTAYMRIGKKQYSASFENIENAIDKVKEYEKMRGELVGNCAADIR
jgi:hypothetical protein